MKNNFRLKLSSALLCLFVLAGTLAGCNISVNVGSTSHETSAVSSAVDYKTSDPENSSSVSENSSSLVTVHFLDAGQGDSIFSELPDGKTMLIDASTADCGENIVKYIKNKGYSKVDYLVATHPHADHIGGMTRVVNQLDIGEIYMPKASATTKTYKNLLTAIKDKGKKINTAKAGVEMFSYDGISANILAPNSDEYEETNNYSAVVKLVCGEKSFLFMGDAEKESEDEIRTDVSADVLKVGHHGSSSSTSGKFLNKVSPQIAVISCGKDNSYGHPHKETLSALESAGVRVYRTDEMGTITVTTDGKALDVSTGGASVKGEI